ncbi:MAG: M20 family metallopeptidase [Chloroflexota bacterium]|nr:M20 family metallopeptidase [Chloroflexota bacterium]
MPGKGPVGEQVGIREEDARQVLAAIDPEETGEFLRGLVRIPSVNPEGDVRDAIAYCMKPLAAAGFGCRTVGIEVTKPNLVAEFGQANGPTLCFNAHVDVVPTGAESAWTHPPFGADLADGRVYGRGAGDDKASVTAQVMAGLALARSGVTLGGRLVVNEVADEETNGTAGAKFIVESGEVRPDFVIVGEQTLNRVCVGEKGTAGATITTFGRAAHGALPWEGANAIEAMGRVVAALQDELWPRLEARTHPFFHHSSGSINMVQGGVKSNVVPDRCSVYVDRRLVPGEDPAETQAEIEEIARLAVAGIAGTRVEVQAAPEVRPATMSEPDSPLVRAMIGANQYLGLSAELTGFSMASDGRFFAAAGYPTIIYGPGDPRLAHVPDEWVGVDELLEATRAYALAALALIGGQD